MPFSYAFFDVFQAFADAADAAPLPLMLDADLRRRLPPDAAPPMILSATPLPLPPPPSCTPRYD